MRSSSRGCTVQVQLPHGDPHGIKILSRAGWDGHVLAIPRADVEAAQKLEEFGKGGTVVLIGSTADHRVRVRVGHADSAVDHLPMFRADQRWTQLFVLGREGDFPKVLARRIALSLAEAARRTGLAEVVDAYSTAPKEVPATVRAEAETFTREALIFLALCGVTVFGTPAAAVPASAPAAPASPVAPAGEAGIGTRNGSASPTKHTSIERVPPAGSFRSAGKAHYDEDMLLLLDLGMLRPGQQLIFDQPRKGLRHIAFVEPDGGLRFQNTRYVSPSGAAVAAAGRSSNGWICWRTTDGRLLDDLRKSARKRKGKV
ncbi:DUF4357 domain-containing protein [Nocardia sp. NPDC050799]|uniref:DUF4357 domain-containing protein n=1 Tax=Nocardia sp. NPDC050799 TaxID=3154842 RepID=UPI0033D3A258